MASAIIHMCVAKKVNEIIKQDEKMLSLGSIAPDIAKLVGEKKNKSHFLDPNAEEDSIPDCDKFYTKYKKDLDKPFELGYLIHLLTDKYWFKDYIYKYIANYDNQLDYVGLKSIIYNDYTRLNTDLIDEYNLDLYFMFNEITLPKSKIKEIPISKLNILINKMSIIIANMDKSKPQMFNIKDITQFIEECSNNIINDLKTYGLIEDSYE